MESKVNYTVVGLFVILLGAAFIIFFFWLSTFRHERTYNIYAVYVNEDVTGLSVQSPVRFSGVPVGYVKAIELDPKNPQLVRLLLNIVQGTPITESTVATLQFQGITGVLYVGLSAKTLGAPLLQAKGEEEYPVIPSQPSFIVQLSEVLPEITKDIKTLGTSIGKLLNDRNRKSISETFQNIQQFTGMLSDNSAALQQSIRSLNTTLKNTAIASQDLPDVMQQLRSALASVKQTSMQVGIASNAFRTTMTSGKVLVDNFSNQVMPSTQQLLAQLNRIANNIQQVTSDLQRNPSILIRGKQPPPPGPGER